MTSLLILSRPKSSRNYYIQILYNCSWKSPTIKSLLRPLLNTYVLAVKKCPIAPLLKKRCSSGKKRRKLKFMWRIFNLTSQSKQTHAQKSKKIQIRKKVVFASQIPPKKLHRRSWISRRGFYEKFSVEKLVKKWKICKKLVKPAR